MTAGLQEAIDAAFERRQELKPGQDRAVAAAVESALKLLDSGTMRVAEKKDGAWVVNEWLKKAIFLSFRLNENRTMGQPEPGPWWDKVPLKFSDWMAQGFQEAGFARCRGRWCAAPPISRRAWC